MLSGNRNFEGRINPDVRTNYLASPPLVVAYALAGTMDIDLSTSRSAGHRRRGRLPEGHLAVAEEVARVVEASVHEEMFRYTYDDVFEGDERWQSLEIPEGDRFAWDERSTYVRRPPFLEDIPKEPEPPEDIEGARVLAMLGDSRHHRPHLARRRDQEGHARRRSTSTSTASSRATSTPTARAAATTR